jgi:L-seryl-tRNA(Ser) seleniumtransferase
MIDEAITTKVKKRLRELPSIDRLLKLPAVGEMVATYGRSLTLEALRHSLETVRAAILNGSDPDSTAIPGDDALAQNARDWLDRLLAPTLHPVINATGVIIHTNLGRAPLSAAALAALQTIGSSFSTLEYDLAAGERGSRSQHAEALLTRLTGAEAALVVNNNAAAILLLLSALCQGKEVIISRGQLVEIGGGFRIPDVLAQSGAQLVEVGTTNRTHLYDYERAITENTAAIMVAHYSNYKVIGFTSAPSLSELAVLAHKHGLPLLYDQGSGALLDVAPYGLEPEPTVPDGLQAGCDLVAFSGDKLLGGPQAGIICGQAALVTRLKRHPLTRAIRADKLCLAALAATLTHYLKEEAVTAIPVWRMIARPAAEIQEEANRWATQLQAHGVQAVVINGRSAVGGGSLPGTSLPTWLVALEHEAVSDLAARLRVASPAVIGRIQDGRFLLDPRTVLPDQAEPLLHNVTKAYSLLV